MSTLKTIDWPTLLRTVKDRPTRKNDRPANSGNSSQRTSTEWSGGSWADAMKKLRFGWPGGVREIEKLTRGGVTSDNGPAFELDVAGYLPVVGAYVAGDPECMLVPGERGTIQRVVLVVSCIYNCGYSAEQAACYAAALAQVVAELDAAGVDVAVYALDVTRGSGSTYCMSVAVRQFGEPLDLSKIAFAFHPMFLRRVLFAWRELDPVACRIGVADGGYGSVRSPTREYAVASIGQDAEGAVILPDMDAVSDATKRGDTRAVVAAMREAIKEQSQG
jgi:hypothetical protein